MEKIRIGNDIALEWTILRGGEAEEFQGKDLSVIVAGVVGNKIQSEYTIKGNVICITILGKYQKRCGCYSLYLIENEGKPGMGTIDHVDAFQLVPHSDMEDGEGCSNIKLTSIKLTSNFKVAKSGASAYEVAVANGFVGTEEEWLDSLKGEGAVTDASLNKNSENAVQNKVVTAKVEEIEGAMVVGIDTSDTKEYNDVFNA